MFFIHQTVQLQNILNSSPPMMCFLTKINQFIYFYYIIGQSGFYPYEKLTRKLWERFANQFGEIAFVVVFLSYTLIHFFEVERYVSSSEIISFLVNVYTFSAVAANVLMVYKVRRSSHNLGKLQKHLEAIDCVFNVNLERTIDIEHFRKSYYRKMAFIFVITVLDILMQVLLRVQILITKILQFFETFAIFHVIFFIDLKLCILVNLSSAIESNGKLIANRNLGPERLLILLKYYKFVHYKLWQIVNLIQMSFGWTLMMICMVKFNQAIISFISVFLIVYSNGIIIFSISKCIIF